MSFPQSPRVIFERNPLVEVLCQVRFDPILRINAELPTLFHARLAERYPVFKESPVQPILLPSLARPTFDLTSVDGCWTVGLQHDFVSLATTRYRRWEEFRARLVEVIDAAAAVYAPARLTRVGIRYKDLVERSVLELDGVPWSALLQPHVANVLATPVSEQVIQVRHEVVLSLPIGGQVRILHGFATRTGLAEQCYLVDCDFFTEEPLENKEAALAWLDDANRSAGDLFHWCITDRLREAMRPNPAG